MAPSSTRVTNTQVVLLLVFGIAMGLLEAIVVVYLRALYFPDGFRFPLRFIPPQMLRTEMLRELATLVMLAVLAGATARTWSLRFAVFLFSFGVWDICYYIFLKILLNWPHSLLTWDVLFLIPLTWLGPVLAPVISSLTMIAIGLLFIMLDRSYGRVRADKAVRLIMAAGAALVVLSFIWDYGALILQGGYYRDLAGLAHNEAFQSAVAGFAPVRFQWGLFGTGEALVVLAALAAYRKTVQQHS